MVDELGTEHIQSAPKESIHLRQSPEPSTVRVDFIQVLAFG